MGEEGLPIKLFSILPDKTDCRPAITAFLNANAIVKGFFALAIAVLTRTPSHPSSIAIDASEACMDGCICVNRGSTRVGGRCRSKNRLQHNQNQNQKSSKKFSQKGNQDINSKYAEINIQEASDTISIPYVLLLIFLFVSLS